MKKKNFSAIMAALCVALMFTLFTGCGKPEPTPPPPPTPTPEGFVSIVELDAEGKLTKIPYPFVDFEKGRAEVEVWEKAHGSTFVGEKPFLNQITYSYDTKDPKQLNPIRRYDISEGGKGKLTTSTAYYKIDLVYDVTKETPVLTTHFKDLLEKEGFKRKANVDIDMYLNDKMVLVLNPISKDAAIAQYSSLPKEQPRPENFIPIVELDAEGKLTKIPYPFVDFEKGKADVEAWEKEHGSSLGQEKRDEKNGTTIYTYNTFDPDKINVLRAYTIGQHGQGKLRVTMASFKPELLFNLSEENPTLNEHLKALLAAEGYKFLDTGIQTIISYQNQKYMLSFSLISGANMAVAIYMPSSGGGENPGGGGGEQNYAYMLPNLDFGSSFAKGGAIWEKERARGFEAEYTEDLENGNYLRSIPTSKTPQTAIKIASMYYYDKYAGADQTIYRTGVVVFAENLPPNDVKVKEFMKATGFTLVDEAQNTYENNSLNTRVSFQILAGRLEMSLAPIKTPSAEMSLKRRQLEEISQSFSGLSQDL